MARILKCDTPGCDAQAPFRDSDDWRVIEQCRINSDTGQSGPAIVDATICPACTYKLDLLLWPADAEPPAPAKTAVTS